MSRSMGLKHLIHIYITAGGGTVRRATRSIWVEPTAKNKSEQCRRLATNLRTEAARTQLPGFAARMISVAEDLEQQAIMLKALIPASATSIATTSAQTQFTELV